MKTQPVTTPYTLRIPADLRQQAEAQAAAEQRTLSGLIRLLLIEHLKKVADGKA
jgi:hypothetical protein